MLDRIFEAGGEALNDPNRDQGAWSWTWLQMWLNQGADFELDIIPTIARRTANKPPRSINGLTYFNNAMREAPAKRQRVASSPKQAPRVSQFESQEQRREREDKERKSAFLKSLRGRKPTLPAEDGQIDVGAVR